MHAAIARRCKCLVSFEVRRRLHLCLFLIGSSLWPLPSSIDNVGKDTVTVLGREWRIFNGDGSLHREIKRGTSESRMVVGLQPILEPGDSFIYHSGTDVKSRSGCMEGSFQVRCLVKTLLG